MDALGRSARLPQTSSCRCTRCAYFTAVVVIPALKATHTHTHRQTHTHTHAQLTRLGPQVDTLQKQVTEVGQLESIRRQELAELQSKGPPMEVDSSAVEPLLLQVKEVIDELIRVEQGVTSWEQRAADVDKERARLASEAEAERLVRVQQNQGAREQALVQGNLDNNLRRQRAQWEHQRQELVMEASRIRHARISTERVLQETKDTLRTLAAEMEHFLYVRNMRLRICMRASSTTCVCVCARARARVLCARYRYRAYSDWQPI